MADFAAPYRKLPGRGSGVISISTLWEGDTHLLLVTSWPSGEGYRRFFFADIQALILRRTRRRMVINIVLGVLGLPAVAAALAPYFQSAGASGWPVGGGILAGACLFGILVNSLLGATCTLHVQTPIRCERLPTVRRVRQARRVINHVQPLIVTAQPIAEVSPEQEAGGF